MRAIVCGLFLAASLATPTLAQNTGTQGGNSGNAGGGTNPAAAEDSLANQLQNAGPGAQGTPMPGADNGHNNVSSNEAVATERPLGTQPATGANSFTMGQAKSRFQNYGFNNVSNLRKDKDGIWRADAQKDGKPVHVWLDYKGVVGQG